MLVTQHRQLRQFWYPTVRVDELRDGPKPFTLLGQNLVLWLAGDQPAAAVDRCPHRSATLSSGKLIDGMLSCPYHGWRFDGTGACVHLPQAPEQSIPDNFRVRTFHCAQRYGFVWVSLEQPVAPIPDIAEADDPAFRAIAVPRETWACSGLVVMENLFDNAHHHFVHPGSIGDRESAFPPPPDVLKETEQGIVMRSTLRNYGSPAQASAWGVQPGQIVSLVREFSWFMPFATKLHLIFPNGLEQITILVMTPVGDCASQLSAVVLRGDSAEQTSDEQVLAQSALLLAEDRAVLETVGAHTPLDLHEQRHMASDKAGIMIRRRMAELVGFSQ